MTAEDSPSPEPSIFTRIIQGELPGRFVWRDDDVVAFLTIAPIQPGHTMVVPVRQVDHWVDVDAATWGHMAEVQQAVGSALQEVFSPARVGSMILGMEVPHCHVHLVPIEHESDLSFANADNNPDPTEMDRNTEAIRKALRSAGYGDSVPG
ncbi:MAG: HIT family protein [Actinomycetia bacterium]|nr:HIT family protein [Actinomycetes bacterium]